MTENEIVSFIHEAEKCQFHDIKENWILVTEWNTEHMVQYRLYLDKNRRKKVVVVTMK